MGCSCPQQAAGLKTNNGRRQGECSSPRETLFCQWWGLTFQYHGQPFSSTSFVSTCLVHHASTVTACCSRYFALVSAGQEGRLALGSSTYHIKPPHMGVLLQSLACQGRGCSQPACPERLRQSHKGDLHGSPAPQTAFQSSQEHPLKLTMRL